MVFAAHCLGKLYTTVYSRLSSFLRPPSYCRFLEFFAPGPHFVICAVAIRAVHATGNAFVITATFTYAAVEFENSVGTIFSLTRFAMNFAQLLGPSIGGAIYEAGGFYLPFVAMGSLQMLMGILSIFCLPRSRRWTTLCNG